LTRAIRTLSHKMKMPKVFCIVLFPSPGSDYIETSNIIIDLALRGSWTDDL
jgi:hypothetical protein